MEELRYCKKCDCKKPLTEEFWHHRKSRKDGWEFYCKECVQKTTKKNYNKNKEQWREYQKDFKRKFKESIQQHKETLNCSKCNENRWHLLDFHHLDPSTKSFGIGNAWCYKSLKDAFEEMKKCIPLCSNCHREFHYLEKTNNITIEQYLNNGL
jgi:predicted GNAT family acetyltransferase